MVYLFSNFMKLNDYQNYYREMLTCALKVHVKNSTNRNYVLEIVLIYCSKFLILIFFIKFLPLMELN